MRLVTLAFTMDDLRWPLIGAVLLTVAIFWGHLLVTDPEQGSSDIVGVKAAVAAPRAWVCVTPGGFCATAPKPKGEPCTCFDSYDGTMLGRTRTEDTDVTSRWPNRGAVAGDDPLAGLLWGP